MSYIADGKSSGPAITWPNGARIAVMVTFDYDAESLASPAQRQRERKSDSQTSPADSMARTKDFADASTCSTR